MANMIARLEESFWHRLDQRAGIQDSRINTHKWVIGITRCAIYGGIWRDRRSGLSKELPDVLERLMYVGIGEKQTLCKVCLWVGMKFGRKSVV